MTRSARQRFLHLGIEEHAQLDPVEQRVSIAAARAEIARTERNDLVPARLGDRGLEALDVTVSRWAWFRTLHLMPWLRRIRNLLTMG